VSRQKAPALLASGDPLAGKERAIELFNRLDGHAGLRNALRDIAKERGEWAGIPMPLTGNPLTIEPSYPKAKELMAMGYATGDARSELERVACDAEFAGGKMVNSWYSAGRGGDIIVIHDEKGRATYGLSPGVHNLSQQLQTLGSSDAWGLEQESRAVHLLGTLLRHRPFKQYMLTGAFLESSKRSGVMYMFRRLRPTVAISMRGKEAKILASLCLHPIGYYKGSWAGAMCPTDDVIAHLMLMRADEHMFWKRANLHPAYRPEAGL